MNQKTKQLLVIFFLTFFLWSCNKEAPTNPDQKDFTEIVPIDIARKIAIAFAGNNFSGTTPLREATANKRFFNRPDAIKTEETINAGNKPGFYVFNLKDNGGFVIVSAEKKEHPVLAYNNSGAFTYENAPYGIRGWMEETIKDITFIRQGAYDTRKQAAAEWKTTIKNLAIQGADILVDPEPGGCEESSSSYSVGPLMATTWGQGCGYNEQCPTNTSGWRCGHFPTGCVATAMAQVMRYWQRPVSYNWSTMSNSDGWSTETARLMRNAGLAVNMSYGDNGSGAKHENIPGAMTGTFGYASAQNINYGSGSYMTVKSNLNASRPVLLSGCSTRNTSWFGLVVEYKDCHEWVCDGYLESTYYWCNPDGSQGGATYLHFNMNWGWDGSSNGWYGYNNWAPPGFNFQYCQRAIVNIFP